MFIVWRDSRGAAREDGGALTNRLSQLWNRLITRPAAAALNTARTAVVSLTMGGHLAAANKWRDLFNPLRGLTMTRLVGYLEEGGRGAFADLQWLYHFIEKRDATLRGGKRSLISAVTEMEWEVKTVEEKRLPKGFTVRQAEAQATALRTAYDAVGNLTEALEFLCLAEFRGYAHLEKIEGVIPQWLDGGGHRTIVELRPVEQWHWCREGRNGAWQYNAGARSGTTRGEDVDLSRFIVREIDDPINEIAAVAFVRKQLSRKDWDGFIESFGIPSIFAVMPQNVPQGREAEYQDLAEQVISDSRGALPFGSEIKSVDPGARGTAPFEKHLEALDKEIVMAITSGALTMLAESGSGTLAGGAHNETFMRVARALARRVTGCMQRQFDADILAAQFPGQPALAYFEILTKAETDVSEVIEDVAALRSAGYEVDPSQVAERTAYRVVAAGVSTPSALSVAAGVSTPGALPNRAGSRQLPHGGQPHDLDDDFLDAAAGLLAQSGAADFAPLARALEEAMQGGEAGLAERLQALRARLPELLGEVAANTELVTAWEDILSTAALEGVAATA